MKKFLSILLSLVMAVSTMAMFAVSASAESIAKTAVKAESGKTYSKNYGGDYEYYDYKFVV